MYILCKSGKNIKNFQHFSKKSEKTKRNYGKMEIFM